MGEVGYRLAAWNSKYQLFGFILRVVASWWLVRSEQKSVPFEEPPASNGAGFSASNLSRVSESGIFLLE